MPGRNFYRSVVLVTIAHASAVAGGLGASAELTLLVSEPNPHVGDTLSCWVVASVQPEISAIDLRFTYNDSVLRITNVEPVVGNRFSWSRTLSAPQRGAAFTAVTFSADPTVLFADGDTLCSAKFVVERTGYTELSLRTDLPVFLDANRSIVRTNVIPAYVGEVGVLPDEGIVPEAFTIGNYPNPFNGTTVFDIPPGIMSGTFVIYDLLGRIVWQREIDSEGGASLVWNGRNNAGMELSSGLYIYTLYTDATVLKGKAILMK